MRVAICWIGISGYLAACWRALAKRPAMEVKVFFAPTVGTANAPFAAEIAQGFTGETLTAAQLEDGDYMAGRMLEFRPDVIVIPGWVAAGLTALTKNPALAGARFVLAMDTPRKHGLKNNLRQGLARWKLRSFLSRIDRVMVPGERSWQFALLLGFREAKIRRGTYGFDAARFEPIYEWRMSLPEGWPRRFLFAGRYEAVKGIDVLLAAYQQYRARHREDSWPLTCCGMGPMAGQLTGVAGVEDRGFVQPEDQPELWAACGAFVLPSRYEPWGVVIAEACAAGMPVLCTEACGAAVELVRDQFNGFTVASDDVSALSRGLSEVHRRYAQLPEMGARGRAFAAAFSAEAYADRWAAMFEELVESKGKP